MSKVVAIAGYFDPIHEGHLDHIRGAKRLGHVWAIVPTEKQVAEKHGAVFHTQDGRRTLLQALGVDYTFVSVDTDGTCAESLRRLKPDIYANGAEYTLETLPEKERQVCEELGIAMWFGVGRRLNRSSKWITQSSR